jgi:hypothetical protein
MRNWLWRTLACAGGAFAGCGALWAFMPVNADRSFTKAWLLSSPEADTSDAPIQRRSCRLRGRNQSRLPKSARRSWPVDITSCSWVTTGRRSRDGAGAENLIRRTDQGRCTRKNVGTCRATYVP